MSTKAIYEATGKKLLNKYLGSTAAECRCVSVDANTNWNELIANNPWLESEVRKSRILLISTVRNETEYFVLRCSD